MADEEGIDGKSQMESYSIVCYRTFRILDASRRLVALTLWFHLAQDFQVCSLDLKCT